MSDTRWVCSRPNDCTDKCALNSSIKPTGCVFPDEEDIPRDADIWEPSVSDSTKEGE